MIIQQSLAAVPPLHLMVYPLVDLLFVVQDHKGLRWDGVTVEDEAEVTALTLHVCEVDQCGVQSVQTQNNRPQHNSTDLGLRTTEPQTETRILSFCSFISFLEKTKSLKVEKL